MFIQYWFYSNKFQLRYQNCSALQKISFIISFHDKNPGRSGDLAGIDYFNLAYPNHTMERKPKPIFNKRIFRDVNFEKIDYDAKANFVIERVFERGDVDDIRQCQCHNW